ncbi:exonuclease DPD1, chloroplastic/mitochondrial-like [Argentina anserina]|uniref:exonuclease DPD1, chloroplastic/mitochondrial-like n=1 Tax=Argentina anserina TaxID=57926 RepID=UPI0021764947|nr:exonuclease DPD1, chloroplastic/mitochondrial-like [Potentilla anserina]
MRTFSLSRVPRCGLYNLAQFWDDNFNILSRTCGYSYSSKPQSFKIYALNGGNSRKWTRSPLTTNTEGRSKTVQHRNPSTIRHELLDATASTSATVNINKVDTSHYEKTQHHDIRELIADNEDLANLVTTIIFDIETTGFSRTDDRIIEIALQDLQGGENSTFQTLINPERGVPWNTTKIHGISTDMVRKPGVPRMKELIPILLSYIRSRQKPGGYVMLVAHNGRSFDVPFLRSEFFRCGEKFPSNWLFADSLIMARKAMKSTGSESSSKSLKLQDLRVHLGIPLVGSAHRAMSDVVVLSKVFPMLTYILKQTLAKVIVEQSFLLSDIDNAKKKKSSR